MKKEQDKKRNSFGDYGSKWVPFLYNCLMKKYNNKNYIVKQSKVPIFTSETFDKQDPVLTFEAIMEEIEIDQYLKPEKQSNFGRQRYNRNKMLKTVLFGFMETVYVSLGSVKKFL